MSIEDHDAAVLTAEKNLAEIHEQIAAAKKEHAATAPAAAVQAGLALAEAGARHVAAERQIGFLQDALEAGKAQVRAAHEARNAANAEARYREKFRIAVAKRLAAIQAWEAGKAAVANAEAEYEIANKAIEEALANGLSRPPHLREHPLRWQWTIDHSTKVQMPPSASEAALWEQYL